MKEVYYFECEVCGERFDDSLKCRFHELSHMTDNFSHDELMMWNSNGERISLEDLKANYWVLKDIFAVETANETAREYLREMFDEIGQYSPYDLNKHPNEDGLIFWDEDDWVSYEDKLAEVMSIRKKLAVKG